MHCHSCGAEVREGQKFCMECGASLRGVADITGEVPVVRASGSRDEPTREVAGPAATAAAHSPQRRDRPARGHRARSAGATTATMRMPTDTGDLRVVEATSPPVDLTAPIVAVGRSTGQIPAGSPTDHRAGGAAARGGLPRAAAPRDGAPRRRRRGRRRDHDDRADHPAPRRRRAALHGQRARHQQRHRRADRRRRRHRRVARLVRRPTLGRRARRRGRRLARRMGRPADRPHRVAHPRRAGRRGRAIASGSTPSGPPARSA